MNYFNKICWYIKQLIPHINYSTYTDNNGIKRFSIWRQWLGRYSEHRSFPVLK